MKRSRLSSFLLVVGAGLVKALAEPEPTVTVPATENDSFHNGVRRQLATSTCSAPPTKSGTAQPMYNLNKNYGRYMFRALATPGQACASNPDYGVRRNW